MSDLKEWASLRDACLELIPELRSHAQEVRKGCKGAECLRALARGGRAVTALEAAIEGDECDRDLMVRLYDLEEAFDSGFMDAFRVDILEIRDAFGYAATAEGRYEPMTPVGLAAEKLEEAMELLQGVGGRDMTAFEKRGLRVRLAHLQGLLDTKPYAATYDSTKRAILDKLIEERERAHGYAQDSR